LRQAYDYWQDQPGSLRRVRTVNRTRANPQASDARARRGEQDRARLERPVEPPTRRGETETCRWCVFPRSARTESHARGNVHPRRPALLLRGAPGRTFPARPEPKRAMKRTQARAAELASTRDTVAQRRRRISRCDALRSGTIRPLRTDQTRTIRAHFEAPPPTDDAAARATRPRLSLERWPGRHRAPQYEGSQGKLPRG
jgi:hypothetical protein